METLEIKNVKEFHIALAKLAMLTVKGLKSNSTATTVILSLLSAGSQIIDAVEDLDQYFLEIDDMTNEELEQVDAAVREVITLDDKELEVDVENIHKALLSGLRLTTKTKVENDNNG
jgi:hypothetical protein